MGWENGFRFLAEVAANSDEWDALLTEAEQQVNNDIDWKEATAEAGKPELERISGTRIDQVIAQSALALTSSPSYEEAEKLLGLEGE